MNIPEITLLVCVFNEEESIHPFLDQAIPMLDINTKSYEIIFVNDGSEDGTLNQISNYPVRKGIRVINLSRNFGKEIALTAGLDYCKGEAVIPVDVDLQQPLDVIPEFISKWKQGYLNVIGVRDGREYEGFIKRNITYSFYKIISKISSVNIIPNAGDYRLMDRKVINEIVKMRENTRFMKGIFAYPGFSYVTVPYEIKPRMVGESKWNFWKLWSFSLDGIFGFSTFPLKFWSYFGFLICFLVFLYSIFIILKTIYTGIDTPGYTTIIVFILFFGGVQLVSIGILGEYIARIFEQVKNRPLYIVESEIDLNHD